MHDDGKTLLTKIKCAIEEASDYLQKTKEQHNRERTRTIFKYVSAEKVLPSDVSCCCSLFRHARRPNCYVEWLYDMTWYKEDKNCKLMEIVLVLESEWSHLDYEVKYDFEKLLQAKCKLKVLVCEFDDAFNLVEEGIKQYQDKNRDELYLVAKYTGAKFDCLVFDGNGNPQHDFFNQLKGRD
jgi:hypothetical protein